MKWYYILIPLIIIAVWIIGGFLTGGSIDSGWYDTILKPGFTPPGAFIGFMWTTIYIMTAASAIILWNSVSKKQKQSTRFGWIVAIFLLNAFLNVFWSYLFFSQHLIGLAVVDAFFLGLSAVALMILIWPYSKTSSLLLSLYVFWSIFATFLNIIIWIIN